MVLSGLESAETIDYKGFKSVSFWDHLGLSKLFSALGCSRIVPGALSVPIESDWFGSDLTR